MNQPLNPDDRTRLDLHPAEGPGPAPVTAPVVEEEVVDPDHGRRRAVLVVCTIVNVVCAIFAVVLAVHIILVIGEANKGNGFATLIDDWSAAVSLGLRDLFLPDDLKVRTFLNDGIAAIAWLVIGGLITYLIRRLALPGARRAARYRVR